MSSMFSIVVLIVGIIAGGIAAIAGFGIGSLLTPLLALRMDTGLAVAAVSIPHAIGTLVRFGLLREHVERRVLWSFGITSAAGGLVGAFLLARAGSPVLTLIFALLLFFAGFMGITGLSQRLRFQGAAAWIAGALSGLFGGLVGNQGGIRSAAMLGLDVPRDAFVATATAIALFVDAARVPVYLATQGEQLLGLWPLIVVAAVGVVVGTLLGGRVLRRIPETIFRRVVSAIILALGVYMLYKAYTGFVGGG
jgi:uncharacterized membrane protein YfcA